MALARRHDGELIVVSGASRSGKTVWTRRRIGRPRRLLTWDTVGEWGDRYECQRIGVRELQQLAATRTAGRFAFHVPGAMAGKAGRDAFEFFCRAAWIWIRAEVGTLVVEELGGVTSPGKAPSAWHSICSAGLRYGPTVIAITQRPAESDKTCFGNATLLHSHQMVREADEAYMARELRVPQAELAALRPLQWIERDRRSGEIRRGKVAIPRR